ncbi:MAG: NAD-dependent epimerase/dehydratase family protein [Lachnospiraceae bacterium]|nr:NAD-dependent epimerase/dehydratase family protein [Lachnospiraceae bacterium]
MNILVTGAKGFVGRNLIENLKNYRDGKNRTRPDLHIGEIYEYDVDTETGVADAENGGGASTGAEAYPVLREYCKQADFVFNLAGVNRPKDNSEFMTGNFGFAEVLLNTLKDCGNTCPVMLSSSTQATLAGRFADSEYGRSKLAGEELFFNYQEETGAKVLVYRFPNLFGKWCRPNYNSAVATFCNNIANDLPIQVNDPATELELLYIDDLVEEMMDALEGGEHRCDYPAPANDEKGSVPSPIPDDHGRYCYVPVTHTATLGGIVDLLHSFRDMPRTLIMPDIPEGSFAKKLYSTYLSYLPADKVIYDIPMATDERGHFTELIKSLSAGQVSINISKPGITKGQHWHNSKWEIFIVVSGHGLIQERKIGIDPETGVEYPVIEYEVSGERIQAVQMLPGYTHNIINLSDTDDLITVMWANEIFDEDRPETYREIVK